MVNGHYWFVPKYSQRSCGVYSNPEGGFKAWAGGYGNYVNVGGCEGGKVFPNKRKKFRLTSKKVLDLFDRFSCGGGRSDVFHAGFLERLNDNWHECALVLSAGKSRNDASPVSVKFELRNNNLCHGLYYR